MTDDELIMLAQKGDRNAVGAIYDKYVDSIYRYCLWKTNRSVRDSEDLVQDIFLEMAASIKTFRGEGSLKNWLYGIAKIKLIRWIKAKYTLPEAPLFDDLIDHPDIIDPSRYEERIREVNELMARLNDRERQVVERRYLRNLSVKETAAELDMTESNVKVTTHRALKRLREFADVVTLRALNR